MAALDQTSRLTKQLSLFHVYALATGATLSSGLFLLPGLAAETVGPAIVLSYLIAAVPLIPAMFSVMELSTAMPRAGGAYYFLDRSLGPLAGTVGGMGTWLALTLKTAFALVGMGAYIQLFVPEASMTPIACGLAIAFGIINAFGAKQTSRVQVFLVVGLLGILGWFIARGSTAGAMDASHFEEFAGEGWPAIIATAGTVFISYVGVTKVASVSEEVTNPDRNLPRGLFLALGTAVVIYVACMVLMTGVLGDALRGSLTPMADVASAIAGKGGKIAISIAALLAFLSVANAGILSSSRYPLAMSRDHLLPSVFRRLSSHRTPTLSIVLTVGAILFYLLVLDPLKIAKLASAFQLLMFAMICLAVIVMRESRIESYDPGYKSPLYPWMQIAGMVAPIVLILEMGAMPIAFSAGLVGVGIAWYVWYARKRVVRGGAIYHVFERLGRQRFEDLDGELRGILKEKGLRAQDPFLETITRADVLDSPKARTFESIVRRASNALSERLPLDAETIAQRFLEGTRIGATPVAKGTALPHLRLAGIRRPYLVLARARAGVTIDTGDVLGEAHSVTSFAIFFLVSPDGDPGQHLRLLAELASRVDQEDFMDHWQAAQDGLQLREAVLRHERYVSLPLERGERTEPLIDRAIRDLDLPKGSLVAVIRRLGKSIVPGGDTVLHEGDRLTIIGSEESVRECIDQYSPRHAPPPKSRSGGADAPAS